MEAGEGVRSVIGILAVFFGFSAVVFGIIEVTHKDDCEVVSGDILGNVECDEIQVQQEKP